MRSPLVLLCALALAAAAACRSNNPSPQGFDTVYAIRFLGTAARAFEKHRAAGQKAAATVLAFVRTHRSNHDKLKAAFRKLSFQEELDARQAGEFTRESDPALQHRLGACQRTPPPPTRPHSGRSSPAKSSRGQGSEALQGPRRFYRVRVLSPAETGGEDERQPRAQEDPGGR